VIPADRKWFARICVSAVLAHTLRQIDPQFPVLSSADRSQLQVAKAALEAEAPKGTAPDPVMPKAPAHLVAADGAAR